MRGRHRRFAALLTIALPALLLTTSVEYALARLSTTSAVGSNAFTTAASFDTVAPTVSATVIAKIGQYFASFIKQGGAYYVYANATDGGAVPTGITTITADISAVTLLQTAAALSAGSFAVDGVSYGYRSASLTATAILTAGSKSYTITSTDANGNSRLQSGYTVTVDNTAPSASDIQCVNGAATVGRIEQGDICTFTFSEVIDPESILPGWNGTSSSVVVRFTDAGMSDTFAIWNAANATQLNQGSVNTNGDYVSAATTAGASPGTASTMVLNTAASTITVTLGTIAGTVHTEPGNRTASWTPSASAFDRAGNAMSTTTRSETGANDKDF